MADNSNIESETEEPLSHDSSSEEPDFTEIEEDAEIRHDATSHTQYNAEVGPYAEEPLASPDWIQNYTAERKDMEEEEKQLEKRKSGVIPISSW